MKTYFLAAGIALFAMAEMAGAQGLTAVKPIEGYSCMRLRMTHEQAVDRSFTVPVFSQPARSNPPAGIASAIVLVREPPKPQGGFREILFPDGRTMWIETKWLMPFPTSQFPKATCTPSWMSNGRPGFTSSTNQ